MNHEGAEILEKFMTQWVEEFGRAIQMFTGDEATLAFASAQEEDNSEAMTAATWWKQSVKGRESFVIWAGGIEATWAAIAGAVEGGEDSRATFFEMVSQASQGAAAAMSADFPEPLKCVDGAIEAAPTRDDFAVYRVSISHRGEKLTPLLLLIEPEAVSVLFLPMGDKEPGARKDLARASAAQPPKILNRLMDLQLPVSVLLGRASIRIRDVMKVTPGSVIELDRKIGDLVEIIVHGTVVAKGEIVSVKGNYGVRIKEIISRHERIALHEAA